MQKFKENEINSDDNNKTRREQIHHYGSETFTRASGT